MSLVKWPGDISLGVPLFWIKSRIETDSGVVSSVQVAVLIEQFWMGVLLEQFLVVVLSVLHKCNVSFCSHPPEDESDRQAECRDYEKHGHSFLLTLNLRRNSFPKRENRIS